MSVSIINAPATSSPLARMAIATTVATVAVSTTIPMNGTTDYLETFAFQTSGGNLGLFAAANGSSWSGSVGLVTRWFNS